MRTMRDVQAIPGGGVVVSPATVLTSTRISSSVAVCLAVLVSAALIVLRSHVFLHYEQADFDADQAIVGLMAKHLSEGRAWPLFFYGQLYMMGVQAWMAALAFFATGPTVFGLKLPLLIINVATGGLLVWLLVRDAGLRAWQAAVATSWFAVLPPLTASRMVQAQGGTIEPLFYTLILWLVRTRAVVFGLVFAFGFLQREFTVFAVCALVFVEMVTGELFSRRRLAHWLVLLLVFAGAREGVTLLRHTASMFGPHTAAPLLEDGVTNVDVLATSVCLAPSHVAGNASWLLGNNVPAFFGVLRQPAGAFIATARPTGMRWAAYPALLAVAAACVLLVARGRTPGNDTGTATSGDRWARTAFPLLLLVTGVFGVAGVATGCNVRSLMTIRYHLLLAFLPVGLTALAFVRGGSGPRGRFLSAAMTGAIVVWAGAMTWQHVQLVREYRTSPPPSPFRELADDLVAHGDSYGWASYWVSYHVDFLSQERVQLSPTSMIRIADYSRQAFRAGPAAIVVGTDPCAPTDRARKVAVWWVCGGTR
ncbi:MAG: hypothetical protein IT182_12370 [Acidobacteria bacterium]|nr:hypothetical protein [Acidobacteriota bacterium]